MKPKEGVLANSFKPGDKVYIGSDRLLPVEMFIEAEKPKVPSAGGRGGNVE